MTQYRRDVLLHTTVKEETNTSLWLDKYFTIPTDPKVEAKQELIEDILCIDRVSLYKDFFTAWKEMLEKYQAQTQAAKVLNRLAINLGEESILETNIALQHSYGVPFIPGSALKGLAAHFASQNLGPDWGKDSPAYKTMFGGEDDGGIVTFFDALYIPGSYENDRMIAKDVITVHHAEYYQNAEKPPADWDSTTIIPFLTAVGSFLVALAGEKAWVEKAFKILEYALEHEGVGAKTNSGYGRMAFVDEQAQGQPRFKEVAKEKNTSTSKKPTPAASMSTETYEVKKTRLLKEEPPKGWFRGAVADLRSEGRLGLINPAKGGKPVSVHINGMPGKRPPKIGQVLEYRLGEFKGNPQAIDVKVLLEK